MRYSALKSPWGGSLLAIFCGCSAAGAETNAVAGSRPETTEVSICRLIESSARSQDLPVSFLTRLIWQESSFRPNSISPAGAEGIAQFMPRTAGERGLANPFDPEQAIPEAARLLHDLKERFGNLGLAAAAYNAGPGRVADWLAGRGGLPSETRNYVEKITRHTVEDWKARVSTAAEEPGLPETTCPEVVVAIRHFHPSEAVGSVFTAPWGVQFAGSHSKPAVLAAYARVQHTYPAILGNIEPMVLAGRVAGFGWATYYQIRAPAASRAEADALCNKILRVGGACAVLRN
jgi:Transglycosylase SLT domain/SPOR domain